MKTWFNSLKKKTLWGVSFYVQDVFWNQAVIRSFLTVLIGAKSGRSGLVLYYFHGNLTWHETLTMCCCLALSAVFFLTWVGLVAKCSSCPLSSCNAISHRRLHVFNGVFQLPTRTSNRVPFPWSPWKTHENSGKSRPNTRCMYDDEIHAAIESHKFI